jgi:hypothetical protein
MRMKRGSNHDTDSELYHFRYVLITVSHPRFTSAREFTFFSFLSTDENYDKDFGIQVWVVCGAADQVNKLFHAKLLF